ncbi:hypothetical protein VaNZ11_015828 [Volvox africanus]|uniref:Uncharacterized protein n=1 Tax=Volvox africanus TaxID=51714 RepID=A0ABQ5SMC9_9CHLO|nr:hypothetical protein VaNZ11_015828 [Volvox africanus]
MKTLLVGTAASGASGPAAIVAKVPAAAVAVNGNRHVRDVIRAATSSPPTGGLGQSESRVQRSADGGIAPDGDGPGTRTARRHRGQGRGSGTGSVTRNGDGGGGGRAQGDGADAVAAGMEALSAAESNSGNSCTVSTGSRGSRRGGGSAGRGKPASAPSGMSLSSRVRACRSVEELVGLYDTAQREAEAAARSRASSAGAAAAAAGLAAGAAGLAAGTVWMFLAAAGSLVAGWRKRIPSGYRTTRLGEAKEMRTQLSRLLAEACGVVLWAERLGPAKVCLLLSLMVVAGGRYPGVEQHLGLLVEDSLNSLEEYSSGEVALAASSFARLHYFPGTGWLETLLEATSGRLSSWRPIDLGFLMWALAKWRTKLPATWLQEYYTAFEGCGERVRERELAMVCWAVGVGAVGGAPRPPDSFTNRLMMEVQVRLPSFGSQGLAHIAWGLCCCDVKPPRFWLRDFTMAAKATLPYANNGMSFSNLLWALANWQGELHPGEELLAACCKHSARWLCTLDSRGLAVTLLALSDLGHIPPVEWVGLALETAHRKLTTTDPSSAVAILWAISRFERQRAATAAAAAAEAAAMAATGANAAAAAAVPLPPRRRRLTSLTPEELLLVADDIGFGFGLDADGRTLGSAGTPLALRPPRKWLVRYYPLIKDFAMAAAGVVPTAASRRSSMKTSTPLTASLGRGASIPDSTEVATDAVATPSRFAFAGLDTNQMLDLAVALADLYVYPGDTWMAAHEAHMALTGGGGGGSGRNGSGSGSRGSLTPYQLKLLMASYAALDDTAEEYAAPRAGEMY